MMNSCNNYDNKHIDCDEQYSGVTTKRTNVNDGREYQRGKEKGEREIQEDDVKRKLSIDEQEKERERQIQKSIDLVTSFQSEQYNCPIVNNSMTNLVSTSFNSNILPAANRSRHSLYASYPTYAMNPHYQDYEPVYSPIPRTASSLSPYRKTHYLDESDEEILNDEIVQITYLDHYPTLIERWGEDTKTVVRQDGDLKIEDYVEFEELEPTVTEEISYEITYSGDQIQSTRETHHTRVESRNFRKIKKRRTKRKRIATPNLHSIIQTGDNFSKLNNDLPGDNHQFSARNYLADKCIPSTTSDGQCSNFDIIAEDVSKERISPKFADHQNTDLFNKTRSECCDNANNEVDHHHRSYFNVEKQTRVLQNNHEMISIAPPSINQFNQDQSNLLASEFLPTVPNHQIQFFKLNENQPTEEKLNDECVRIDNEANLLSKSSQSKANEAMTTSSLPSTDMKINRQSITKEQERTNSITSSPEVVEKQTTNIFERSMTKIPVEQQQLDFNENEPTITCSALELGKTELNINQQSLTSTGTSLADDNVELLLNFLLNTTEPDRTTRFNTDPSAIIHFLTENNLRSSSSRNTTYKDPMESDNTMVPAGQTVDTAHTMIEDINNPSGSLTKLSPELLTLPTLSAAQIDKSASSPVNTNAEPSILNELLKESKLESIPLAPELSRLMNTVQHCIQTSSPVSTESLTNVFPSNLLQNQYLPFDDIQVVEEKDFFDLTKVYFELQEQRRLQTLDNNIELTVKQSDTDVPTESCKLESFSIVSNLPFKEYHQIFGISNIIDNTADQICYITLSDESEDEQMKSTNKPSQIEEQSQSIYIGEASPSDTNESNELEYQSKDPYTEDETCEPDSNLIITDLQLYFLETIEEEDEPLSSSENSHVTVININTDSNATCDSLPTQLSTIALEKLPETETRSSSVTTADDISANTSDLTLSDERTLGSEHSCHIADKQIQDIDQEQQPFVLSDPSWPSTTIPHTTFHRKSSTDVSEKPYSQQPQTLNDDYPWYPSHYSIVDAEVRIAQIYNLLAFGHQQTFLSTIVEAAAESDEQVITHDEDVHHVLRHQEHIRSSLVPALVAPMPIYSIHSDISTSTMSSAAPQTANTSSKRKHRRKKKEKRENISSDLTEDIEEYVLLEQNEKSVDEIDSNSTTFSAETKENNHIHERIVPSHRAWYSTQYKIADTESERLLFTQPASTIDETGQIETEQKLQFLYDDYPWYSSYYTIVDAETKLAQLHSLLDFSRKQSTLLTSVQHQNQERKTTHEDSFQIAQHHERTHSSATQIHVPSLPPSISITEISISSNIDSAPAVAHEQSQAVTPMSSVASQPTGTTIKKKHKKKKKEELSSDISEPTLSNDHKQDNLAQAEVSLIELPEKLSHSNDVISNTISSVDLHLRYSLLLDRLETLIQPFIVSSPDVIETKRETVDSTALESEEVEQHSIDDTFTAFSPATSTKSVSYSDINVESTIVHDHSTPLQTTTATNKKRHRRRKKARKESVLGDTTESTTTDISIQDQEYHSNVKIDILPELKQILESEIKSAKSKKKSSKKKNEINAAHDRKSTPTPPPPEPIRPSAPPSLTIPTKSTATKQTSLLVAEEEDDDGFQLVTHRKRLRSGASCEKMSPLTIDTSKLAPAPRIDAKKIAIVYEDQSLLIPSNTAYKTPISPEKIENKPVFAPQSALQEERLKVQNIFIPPPVINSLDEDDDDDGFQVVRHRRRMKSAPGSDKARVHSLTKTSSTQTSDTDVNVKSVTIHERPNSTSRSIPRTHIVSTSPSKTIQHETRQSLLITKKFQPSTLNTCDTIVEKPIAKDNDSNAPKAARQSKARHLRTTLTIFNKSNLVSTTDKSSTETLVKDYDTPQSTAKTSSTTPNDADSIHLTAEDPSSQSHLPSASDETSSTANSYEIIATPHLEPVQDADESQILLQTDKSSTSLIIVLKESTGSSDENSIKDNLAQTPKSVEFMDPTSPFNEIPTPKMEIPIEPIPEIQLLTTTTHVEDRQVTTVSNKRKSKSRKKKTLIKTKDDDEDISTSSTTTSISSHITHINLDSPQSLSKANFSTNDKLDLFLPDYIREKLNGSETYSSSSVHSHDEHDVTSAASSFEFIPARKSRPKMLAKDHEAKTLLTNEFDSPSTPQTYADHQATSTDDDANDNENIHDEDDEFIIQVIDLEEPEKTPMQNIDNILSRGFYLWLQEGQALSQPSDKSTSSSSSSKYQSNHLQHIVIQPTETDEDEDSWNSNEIVRSTYITGNQPEKKIHMTSAYVINHPQSNSTTSWYEISAHNRRSHDDLARFDSDGHDHTERHQNRSQQSNTRSQQCNSTNGYHHQQTMVMLDEFQESLLEDLYRQSTKDSNHAIHFDDWAHFFENEFEIEFTSPLECFYTRPYDEDTLVCEVIPMHHSIRDHESRYGDFSTMNNDIILTEPVVHYASQKLKPSDCFQRSRHQESTPAAYDNDEILITHSPNGLSRRMNS
ncbi:unnamed protein product [Adineta ricciae]|uniref:Uncharacterized protein n=1 Tax=Adineta ricciae TaxID=249248 RepID=A0A814LTY5_ADIRI|nr:unnamed protein product [Adineta ricciae]CAF1069192.1 unnamed protein product [Adineta ricciae]